jgi:hypothetical protein
MKTVSLNFEKLMVALFLLMFASVAVAETPASYVRPDTDLSQYSKVLVKPLNMDNTEVLKPAWEDDPEDWVFEPDTKEAVQAMFMEAMTEEIENDGGYPVVTKSGEGVLRIEVETLSITPYTKPGTQAGDDEGYVVSTLGSGDVVISAEIRDSVTRELLILVEGERKIGTQYKVLSPENHEKNLRQLFHGWGKRVRTTLDQAHAEKK